MSASSASSIFARQFTDVVRHIAEHPRFAAGQLHLRRQRNAIAVADLKFFRRLVHRDDFIAGRENRDRGFSGPAGASVPLARPSPVRRSRCRVPFFTTLSPTRVSCPSNTKCALARAGLPTITFRLPLRVFHHHDGVRTARHGRAGHDLHAGSRLDRAVEWPAGPAFAD